MQACPHTCLLQAAFAPRCPAERSNNPYCGCHTSLGAVIDNSQALQTDLLYVALELWGLGILERHSQGRDLVVVGATLECGEDCKIDFVREVIGAALRLTLDQALLWLRALQRHRLCFKPGRFAQCRSATSRQAGVQGCDQT